MKKLHIFIVGLLAGLLLINLAGVSAFAQSAAPDAATLNDLQGQASGSYQSNGLNQDVGNVSTGGASGAAGLLKGDSQQTSLDVVGAPANQTSTSDAKKVTAGWIVFGAVLLFVLIAPLILLYKNSVDAKLSEEKPKKESSAKKVKKAEVAAETKDEVKKEEKPAKTKTKNKKSKNVNKAKRGKKKKK